MRWVAFLLLTALPGALEARGADPQPRIAFELLTKPGVPLTASQQWYKALTDLGISGLQIRAARPGDEMGISKQATSANGYRVVGILAADNVLYLPGGKFKLTDTARLGKWLESLGDEGAEGVTEPRAAFGFTPSQLAAVHDDLKRPVGFSTKDMPAAQAVNRIAGGLKFPLALEDAARGAMQSFKVADELSGLSCGTALAAILGPAGLALAPVRPRGGQLQYRITPAQVGRESWPVGWKPKAGPKPLPELFEYLNVEIHETSVAEALAAIAGRLKAPLVFDAAALAAHGIDPATIQADVPQKRMTYSQILGKVLMQARLKYELRVDEADKPFLWITSVKPAG